MRYKLQFDGSIFDIETNWFIPKDPRNRDYQEYLAWLAEGNEPEPADEPAQQLEE